MREEAAPAALRTRAPAKVNLTLHVLGRRADGYHALESLVVFAGVADHLELHPGAALSLSVAGPRAAAAGPTDDNLVLRAARHLTQRRPGLAVGAFRLIKRLPAAAGIGGGSSDAAAALRLLARLNGLAPDDPDIAAAARATGADVAVCLDPRARMMRGAGEDVGPPLALPPLVAVLVNPGVAVSTPGVFQALGLQPGEDAPGAPHPPVDHDLLGRDRSDLRAADPSGLIRMLATARNDLEPPASVLAPEIGEALGQLRSSSSCHLARMSGSGATVFGLFGDRHAAARTASWIRAARPGWWVTPTLLR